MLSKVYSAAFLGLACDIVEVEVDLGRGLPTFGIVGLGDTAVQESKERCRSAIKNSGFSFFQGRITVNLAPADMRKFGPGFDLPIALGILLAQSEKKAAVDMKKIVCIGELALEGSAREVRGILPLVTEAKRRGYTACIVPMSNAKEASIVSGIEVYGVANLEDALAFVLGEKEIAPEEPFVLTEALQGMAGGGVDLSHIRGNAAGKRALTIAAAGGHNLLFLGPPGSGKTMLAQALPTILPDMTADEMLEVTNIYSVAGLLQGKALVTSRPFRTVHHTASSAAIIGGGSIPHPGEVSLAHRGVLFLDEFAEFPGSVLDTLRQPLEDGCVTISRASGTLTFPAGFMLVAAMNPPGSTQEDPDGFAATAQERARFAKKISGPLLDRIDILLEIPRQKFEILTEKAEGETSAMVRETVQKARNMAERRYAHLKIRSNRELSSRQTKEYCALPPDAEKLMERAVEQFKLSGRAYFRTLKVARTIADLAESEEIGVGHLAEALQYRIRLSE